MLLVAAGATIALVLLGNIAAQTRLEGDRLASTGLERTLQAAQIELEDLLTADPGYLLSTVWTKEKARVCLQTGAVYQPGDAWPAGCGSVWSYTAPAAARAEGSVFAQVTMPAADDALLRVDLAARAASTVSGVQLSFRMRDAGAFTAASVQGGLDFEPARVTAVTGAFYSADVLGAPSGAVTAGQFFTEQSVFNPNPSGSSARWYADVADIAAASRGERRLIREVLPAPLSMANLAAGAAVAERAACPDAPSQNVVVGATERSSALCFAAGRTLTTSTGQSVTVPSGVTGYLILPGATSLNTVDVYAVTELPEPATCAGTTAGSCDPYTDAATQVTAEQHPGVLATWTNASPGLLGSFFYPANGVLFTETDAYLGLCGATFVDTAGACTTYTAGANLTVVAGSGTSGADVYLSGPLVSGSGRFAVIASDQVLIPYWAHVKNGDLTLDVAAVALNLGSDANGITRFPQVGHPVFTAGAVAGALTLRGSFVSDSVLAAMPGFSTVEWTTTIETVEAPPAFLPGPSAGWEMRNVARLTAPTAEQVLVFDSTGAQTSQ